mmetsp:Transcript_27490/g.27893  ORF Transcript_27490/g.27893 Transcript_27490/m.27893 type:complete len:87 (-) Transcript_27490:538-798(-)
MWPHRRTTRRCRRDTRTPISYKEEDSDDVVVPRSVDVKLHTIWDATASIKQEECDGVPSIKGEDCDTLEQMSTVPVAAAPITDVTN